MLQPDRVKKFIVDDITSDSVKEVLMQSFTKKRDFDVHMTAAQMLAVQLLNEGWKDLEKYKNYGSKERPTGRQVGL